jgi:site-specific DNA-methyltransferase (adenine-specific)
VKNQVFGIAITQLTSLLARRSVYCSKAANGEHSIGKDIFDDEAGNIWFEPIQHSWVGGRTINVVSSRKQAKAPKTVERKCDFCGVSENTLNREEGLETHGYAFIHNRDIQFFTREIFGGPMQFDVIIGNPPYQLSTDGSGGQARPIYHLFIEQAIKLDPRFLVMVTPSRWFTGGMGLDSFRNAMLADTRLREIVDFIREKDAFPNVNINGGVNYFLWDKNYDGPCKITSVMPGGVSGEPQLRFLNEFDIFIRHNSGMNILRKVIARGHESFSRRVSPVDPFRLPTTFHGSEKSSSQRKIKLYGSGSESYISASQVNANAEWISLWKVLIPNATDGNETYPLPIWNQRGPIIAGPNTASTFTYLVATLAASEEEARNVATYMRSKFFRFMVFLRKNTQHNKAETFLFVPDLPMDKFWTDADLYKYFKISEDEINYIDSMIRSVEYPDV